MSLKTALQPLNHLSRPITTHITQLDTLGHIHINTPYKAFNCNHRIWGNQFFCVTGVTTALAGLELINLDLLAC